MNFSYSGQQYKTTLVYRIQVNQKLPVATITYLPNFCKFAVRFRDNLTNKTFFATYLNFEYCKKYIQAVITGDFSQLHV